MNGLKVREEPPGEPQQNMDRDLQLAEEVRTGTGTALLRIYGWNRPAVSISRAQRIEDLPADLRNGDTPVVRRPTGGGAVLHDSSEITYALALSRVRCRLPLHDLPVRIHQKLFDRLKEASLPDPDQLSLVCGNPRGTVSVCFSSPVCGDLLYRGRKTAGSAVRAWKEHLLLQGSLQGLPVPAEKLRRVLVQAVQETISPWR